MKILKKIFLISRNFQFKVNNSTQPRQCVQSELQRQLCHQEASTAMLTTLLPIRILNVVHLSLLTQLSWPTM